MTGALCCFCSLYTSTTVEYKHRVIYSVYWCCIVCTGRPYYKREKCLKLLMKNSYSSSSSIVVKIIKFTVILMGKFFKPVNINICCCSSDLTYSITLLLFFSWALGSELFTLSGQCLIALSSPFIMYEETLHSRTLDTSSTYLLLLKTRDCVETQGSCEINEQIQKLYETQLWDSHCWSSTL